MQKQHFRVYPSIRDRLYNALYIEIDLEIKLPETYLNFLLFKSIFISSFFFFLWGKYFFHKALVVLYNAYYNTKY